MKTALRLLALLVTVLFAWPAHAQVPDTLRYSIPSPFGAPLDEALLGFNVAVEGEYAVVATLGSFSYLGENSIKVFNSATGAPLLSLPAHPSSPISLGYTIAISGSLVAVDGSEPVVGSTSHVRGVYVFDLASATPQTPIFALHDPNPGPDNQFGSSLAISGSHVVVGASYDSTVAHHAGTVYVYDLSSATPTVPLGKLIDPNAGENHFFGRAAAMSGTRVVTDGLGGKYIYDLANGVAAPPVLLPANWGPFAISGDIVAVGDSNGSMCQVFDLASAAPTVPVASLPAPSNLSIGTFGNSIAVSGRRVVVGDNSYGIGWNSQGRAYFYDLDSATPDVPVATLENPTPGDHDLFGLAVAIAGDRVVIGAPYDDTAGTNTGSAYVYSFSAATPDVPTAVLTYPDPMPGDSFGLSIAISGTRMVVGAPQDQTGADYAGSAYVYDLASPTPAIPILTLHQPGHIAYDLFGYSVAIEGTRVAVGTEGGRVHVYDLASATPSVPIFTMQQSAHVHAVILSGSYLLASGIYSQAGVHNGGSIFVYDLAGASPTLPIFVIDNPTPADIDYFGSRMAIDGMTLVVGADLDDAGATDAGAAYIYRLDSVNPTVPMLTLTNPHPTEQGYFGGAVAIRGTQVAVGSSGDNTGATHAGSVYLYDLTGDAPAVPVRTLLNPAPDPNDSFGGALVISDSCLVVGAYNNIVSGSNAGSVYVYDLTSAVEGGLVATFDNPNPAPYNYFGYSLALEGSTLVIGTPYDDTITINKGAVYIYGPQPNLNDLDGDGLLDSWETTYFGTTAGHNATDDDEHDGIINLLELAFGTDPLQSNVPAVPAVVNEGGYLTSTISKRAGVNYEVQSAATPENTAFSASTTTILVNDPTTLKVRDNFLVGTPPARFLRVKVTAAP